MRLLQWIAEFTCFAIIVAVGLFSPLVFMFLSGLPAASVMMPIAIAFVAMLTCEQKNGALVVTGNPFVAFAFRLWIYCLIATAITWFVFHVNS